jgi:uroporphyrinogen-III synthase
MRLLSTKKLNPKTKSTLNESGIDVFEVPMIKTRLIDFKWPKIEDGIIISSLTALRGILKHTQYNTLIKTPFYCVGSSTKIKLLELGLNIVECQNSAEDLSNKIIKDYSNKTFNYFCGKQRLNTVEKLFKKNGVNLFLSEVYETKQAPIKIDSHFEGILFFSPSAVKSYAKNNSFNSKICFSWGKTTAKEIVKYSTNYFVSKKPEINSLISLIKKHTIKDA